ncbi:MAG: dihydroneopterin aldolase [Epsilonproteobacteria bacterium]|nr:dihydroneopterin aldolase [Campylobacterota bacterium]
MEEFEIRLEDFTFYAIIGVLEKERKIPQKVEVEAVIRYKEWLDYAKVAQFIKNSIQTQQFFLLEDALKTLLYGLKEKFPQITFAKLTLKKPQILDYVTPSVSLSLKFS